MDRYTYVTPALLLAAAGCAQAAPKEAELPNIIFLLVDQYRYSALGCLGEEPVMTPHLDRFISESVLCSEATSPHPVSSPGRAVLMTGQYPHHNGVTGNCTSDTAPYGVELREDAVCWSDILAANGYSLGYIGKWHLDSPREPFVNTSNNAGSKAWNEWCPPSRRHSFDYWLSYGTYDRHMRPHYWDNDATRDDFIYVDCWGPEYEAQKAIDYIDNKNQVREADAPFALVVSMNPPHSIYSQCPQRYKDLYADLDVEALAGRFGTVEGPGTPAGRKFRGYIKDYYACVTGVDEQMGRILAHLDSCGMRDNTIVLFLADHGNTLGINGLSDAKNSPYEYSFRIPLAIRYPSVLRPGVNPLPIDLSDVYPTVFGLMGKSDWIDDGADGEDLSRALKKGRAATSRRPYLDFSVGHPQNCSWGCRGVRDRRYTFFIMLEDSKITETHCFDRRNDPKEKHDIGGSMPESLRRRMMRDLRKELRRVGDPFANQK